MSIKDRLLHLLEQNKGNYISGEEIADALICSRTAVWKAVNALRQEGYEIAAVTNRGYILSEQSDILSVSAVKQYLTEEYHVCVYQELVSTNTVLKQLAVNEHAPEKTVVISDYQTAGKGRLGRSFYSPKGSGLYMSMLLRPKGKVTDHLILTAQAAVAVYRGVKETTGIELDIKWVNDLYYQGKKVCGILSEGQTNFENGQIDFVIIGIGINLYEPESGFPDEIRERAGTIFGKVSEGRYVQRNRLAAEIIRQMYQLAREVSLAPEYIERNMVPGKPITVIDGSRTRRAKAVKILPDGRLQIEEEDHTLTDLVYGEVSVRIAEGTSI